jgi:hypothetical protein
MSDHDRYIRAARSKFGDDIYIQDDICVIDTEPTLRGPGAWISALVFVHSDELEPIPGPTYDVWIGEQEELGPAPGGTFLGDNWVWAFDQSFTCEDDPDGVGARRSAHTYARHLRNTYPCAFVAVRPSGKCPLPIKHFTESSPHA